jgi:phospholipid/cholesterol/gamma-HCH transport system substrate-binding protein
MRRRRCIPALLLLSVLAAALPACALVGGGAGSYKVIAYFPRAVSVFKSSDVRVLGLPAGTVQKIEIQGDKVKITMSIAKDIPIPAAAHAQIIPQSLIGERYIQLTPAWHQGEPTAEDGHVIELADTIVPVEPDEALAALKDFLDSLDPKGLGTLVDNLATDLEGNGATLGSALGELSQLVATFADKDQELLSIVDSFDRLTSTLTTREQQLGRVLDTFSQATQVLADERRSIEGLLHGLASVSQNGLDLVSEHASRLRTDIETITRTAQAIDVNLGSVEKLLDSAPILVDGILGAYNPTLRAFDLRQSFSPLIANVLGDLFTSLGITPPVPICIPIDVACSAGVAGQSASAPAPASLQASSSVGPLDSVLGLVNSPTLPPPATQRPSMADRLAGVGEFVSEAARSLLGVGS